MAILQKFKDLEMWRKPGELSQCIYSLTSLELISFNYRLQAQVRGLNSMIDNTSKDFEIGSKRKLINSLIKDQKFKDRA